MKYVVIVLLASIITAGCASTKEIETASINQGPCTSEMQITDANIFTGETVENLNVYQQEDLIFAEMDVRTYCNAKLSITSQVSGSELRLMLNRGPEFSDSCICVTNLTASFKNIKAGSYTVFVTNSSGSQVLANRNYIVK